jgi:hypothetical protein
LLCDTGSATLGDTPGELEVLSEVILLWGGDGGCVAVLFVAYAYENPMEIA